MTTNPSDANQPETDLDGKVLLPSRINLRDSLRIRRAFGTMPYGAQLLPGHLTSGQYGALTIDDVVTALDRLAARLQVAAVKAAEDEEALEAIRSDLTAVRRIFGTMPNPNLRRA